MFVLVKVTNTSTGTVSHLVTHQESGENFELPSWAKCIAADSDGEVFAYESTNIDIKDGHAAFTDNDANSALTKIGVIPERYMVDGELEGWQWSKLVIEREPDAATAAHNTERSAEEAAKSKVVLDGSMLRARVTEILDSKMRRGEIGARFSRFTLRDLVKDGFNFENYRTADLVLALVSMGLNLATLRDYRAFRDIDDAVEEARK